MLGFMGLQKVCVFLLDHQNFASHPPTEKRTQEKMSDETNKKTDN
jgi:hypothetical protein